MIHSSSHIISQAHDISSVKEIQPLHRKSAYEIEDRQAKEREPYIDPYFRNEPCKRVLFGVRPAEEGKLELDTGVQIPLLLELLLDDVERRGMSHREIYVSWSTSMKYFTSEVERVHRRLIFPTPIFIK